MSQDVITRFIDSLSSAPDTMGAGVALETVRAENVHRLQELYRALARGDLAAAGDAMADDAELEIIASDGSRVTRAAPSGRA